MELKSYQLKVIEDLQKFLEKVQEHGRLDKAFETYWEERLGPYNAISGTGMPPYRNTVPQAAHVCLKVPTAGGKTFLACHALRTIFNASNQQMPKVVVWLVPWSNLLDQTVNALSDPDHPYRQKLNALFNHRVEVYRKEDAITGANFSPDVVQAQLSIIVMSFASLRARRKEDRKVFQESSGLMQFTDQMEGREHLLDGADETSFINVVRSLNPVIVLDESHNAESELSTDMLRNLNPSFILDLTATPKQNSNIVSMVPAIELKKEHMVKLPVVVYNHPDKTEVISSAIHLRGKLEAEANAQEAKGGRHIRPIVLFQAQPKTNDDNTTFDKLKEQLLKCGIPEDEIKIKTATKDELKGIDLMDKGCKVRYIITINALKEGWDCPFAYILASLADKSSAVDVEQILGRVLRQPYVMQHKSMMLNMSYVLTASAKFNETLTNIVNALQGAGFSSKDYRMVDAMPEEAKQKAQPDPMQQFFFPEQTETQEDETSIDTERVARAVSTANTAAEEPAVITQLTAMAMEQAKEMEAEVERQRNLPPDENLYQEMGDKVKRYTMAHAHRGLATSVKLPLFIHKVPKGDIFNVSGEELLNWESLLGSFPLSRADTNIDLESTQSELYKVDVEEVKKDEYSPRFARIEDSVIKEPMVAYILARPHDNQVKDIAHKLIEQIGNMYPIADQEVRIYIERVLQNLNSEQLQDILTRRMVYAKRIREKIDRLATAYAKEQFADGIMKGTIDVRPVWSFPEAIVPGRMGAAISKSLYEREGEMGDFETTAISAIASLPNIAFWHRNLGRGKGFGLNGYKGNHYPDFILMTTSGKVILLETKGVHLNNPDSADKAMLGAEWAKLAGRDYRYFMVYEKEQVEGAYTLEKAKELIGGL
jgi:type III restriction enzyme